MRKAVVPLADFGKLPAHLQSRSKAAVEAANEYITNTGQSGPRISLRGRRFRLRTPDSEEQVLPDGSNLNVVMVGAAPKRGKAKTFYMGEYEPDSSSPPDCSSADGITPDGWIQDPQNPDCATCPNNVWGTAPHGKGKACRDVKRIYVMPPTVLDKDIYQVQVPPASLKHLSQYVRNLAKHGVEPQNVVTSIFFVDAEYPIINFKFAGFLDEQQVKIVDERIAEGDVDAAMDRGDKTPAEGQEAEQEAQPVRGDSEPQATNWQGGGAARKGSRTPPRSAAKVAVERTRSRKAAQQTAAPVEEPQAQTVDDDPELADILKTWGGGGK